MADTGDRAQSEQEIQLAAAMAAQGLKSRVTESPPPHFEPAPEPAFCRACGACINQSAGHGPAGGGKPEIGALCGPCSHQLDKGGR